ncbi:hypothetical protein D043_0572B, partial [Vibrio parahaemolyticus EKP-021]
NISAC